MLCCNAIPYKISGVFAYCKNAEDDFHAGSYPPSLLSLEQVTVVDVQIFGFRSDRLLKLPETVTALQTTSSDVSVDDIPIDDVVHVGVGFVVREVDGGTYPDLHCSNPVRQLQIVGTRTLMTSSRIVRSVDFFVK